MTTQHTAGPWSIQETGKGADSGLEIAPGIARVWGLGRIPSANARRIVACVNACEGISVEDLEAAAASVPSPLLDPAQRIAKLVAAMRLAIDALSCEGKFERLQYRSSGEQIDAAYEILNDALTGEAS